MGKFEFQRDRSVLSTDNNDFVGPELDENLVEENILENNIPIDDRIPAGIGEEGYEQRDTYDEEGYKNDPGGE